MQELKKAQEDVGQLNRVSHRLALTESSKLPAVLSKLLPRLIARVGDNQRKLSAASSDNNDSNLVATLQEIHSKLIEMLSHTIKRVREDDGCALPCVDLLQLLVTTTTTDENPSFQAKTEVDPFTLHLTNTFLTLGVPRCKERSELLQLVPLLLPLLEQETSKKAQAKVMSRLVLFVLGKIMELEKQAKVAPRKSTASQMSTESSKDNDDVMPFLRIDSQYAPSIYELFLDSFLYRPSQTSLPSDGMSQEGMARLNEDNPNNNNAATSTVLLKDRSKLQLDLLDLIAPTLRHALFLNMKYANNNDRNSALGLERTLALLVVASGSSSVAPAVDQQASHLLKLYLDTAHRRQASSLNPANYATVPLLNELLTLCIGQVQAEQLHEQHNAMPSNTESNFPVLGSFSTDLSTKRRAVSVMTSTTLLRFCATALQECNVFDQDSGTGKANNNQILWISTLLEKVTRRMLLQQEPIQPTGLTLTRAKPYVAAVDLLFGWATRLTSYCDNYVASKTADNPSIQQLADLLSQAQSTVSSILNSYLLSVGSSNNSTSAAINNEGNHAIRDSAYGIYCILFRSRTWQNHSTEMALDPSDNGNSSKTQLAKQLFQCTAKEDEKLRPRSVAALDALLSAYQQRIRVLQAADAASENSNELPVSEPLPGGEDPMEQDNPWLQASQEYDASDKMEIDPKPDGIQKALRQLSNSLVPLIWGAAQSYLPKSSRVSAARWASNLLMDFDMISACYVLCFLGGDLDVTASSIAREGLGLSSDSKTVGHESLAFPAPTNGSKLPSFTDIVNVLYVDTTTSGDYSSNRLKRYADFSIKGKAVSLKFSQVCLMNDLYGGEDEAVLLYLQAICETLEMLNGRNASSGPSSVDLLDECAACLQSTLAASQFARRQFASESVLCLSIKDLERLSLEVNSSKARRFIAGSCGKVYEDTELWVKGEESSLQNWLSLTRIESSIDLCYTNLRSVKTGTGLVPALIHGSSFLGAHLIRAFRLRSCLESGAKTDVPAHVWQTVGEVLKLLGQGTLHSDDVVGNSSCDGLGIALSYDSVDAPPLDTNLFECCALSISELSKALAKYSHGDSVDTLRTMKLATTAGVCLSATTTGSGIVNAQNVKESSSNLGPARFTCASALLNILGSMSNRKEEEIALTVGEALAAYADAYSPRGTQWSFSLDEFPSEYDDETSGQLPPHQHVLYVLLTKTIKQSSPHVRTAAAPALLAIVARAARGINTESEYIERALAKEILARLGVVQQVFIKLLSDPKSKHLSRESACLGLAACRGIAGSSKEEVSGELNNRLLRAFGQTTNHGGSAMIETQEQAAERRTAEGRSENETGTDFMEAFGFESTEVGGASGMSEATLGAYREMAGAAFSLGRQDILYALLILSVSHPCWFSEDRRNAYSSMALLGEGSFLGNSSGTAEMQEALRPHLGKLLPRILRACHDPNKQTRDQMKALYNGLTGGGAASRNAISQHLLSTMDTLISNDANKLWRARVGACGALAEIIVGRDWQSLGGGGPVLDDDLDVKGRTLSAGFRLLQLWRVTMRSLDDVRGAVRDSAETLGRGVRALTIRLCDPMASDKSSGAKRAREEVLLLERDASAAAATALRFLIRHGLNQNCAEATGLCLSTLVEVVGIVKPAILEPIIPDLLRSLLLAISGLEPAALNYIQLRTGDQEGLERARLQLSQSGPLASAVNKLLEMLPKVGVETQRSVVPELDSALRMSAGFATRAAVADSVASLCSTCPTAFEFPGASSGNPSVRLLRALYYASERERGQGAKDKMVHAVGLLAVLCPGSSVRSLALKACERYSRSTGNNEDPTSRKSAAAAIRAITIRASHHFSGGKRGDIYGKRILPVAYIGRRDSDKKVSAIWHEVWEEGKGSAIDAGEGESFGTRLEEIILPFLVEECVGALQDVSWARRVSGANALTDLSDLNVLAPIPRSSLTSRTSFREKNRAQYRAKASSRALRQCLEVLTKPRIWTGKGDVLKAAVGIASKWIGAEASPDKDEAALYGWDGESQTLCPWKPILFSPSWTEDLFRGDSWFHASTEAVDEETEDNMNAASEPEAMETDRDDAGDINFDDFDAALADNTPSLAAAEGVGPKIDQAPLTYVGFCKFVLGQALQKSQTISDEYLPYKVAAFKGLAALLQSTPSDSFARPQIFSYLSQDLLNIATNKPDAGEPEPPVAVAGALDVLAACFWDGMGSETGLGGDIPVDTAILVGTLLSCGIKQPAWTVREASSLCLAELVARVNSNALRQHRVLSDVMTSAASAQKDRKFWRVRLSGIKILDNLAVRAGRSTEGSDEEKQLMLESILPFKEQLMGLLRKSLQDSEVKVTALATEALTKIAWWP